MLDCSLPETFLFLNSLIKWPSQGGDSSSSFALRTTVSKKPSHPKYHIVENQQAQAVQSFLLFIVATNGHFGGKYALEFGTQFKLKVNGLKRWILNSIQFLFHLVTFVMYLYIRVKSASRECWTRYINKSVA